MNEGSLDWAIEQMRKGYRVNNWRWGSGRYAYKGRRGLWITTTRFESLADVRMFDANTAHKDGWTIREERR